MDMLNRDSSGSHGGISELRLILVGNIGCGKTLTAEMLLNDKSSPSDHMPSRLSEIRRGVSEGRYLKIVETPRWYWNGKHIDTSVQRETERALSLVAPGPHAFLILVPVGQFTEMEGRIPTELERVFGRGALQHSLVLLTCGDYLIGRDHDRYVRQDETGLSAMVNECGGRWHVINNRRSEDRQQVISLLEKVEQLTERAGGCYLPSAMQSEKEHELQRRYSMQEKELVHLDHRTLTQTTWSKEETWDESGKRGKIRVRSMGPATGRLVSQQMANGLDSQPWYDDSAVGLKLKRPSFKLSREGAILSQLSETDQPVRNQSNQNFINTVHYQINTMDGTSPAPPSLPSPTATIASYSPSSNAFPSSSSTTFSSSSLTDFSTSSSTKISSSPSTTFAPSSSTKFSSYSSATLPSSPTNASFSPSSNALFSSSSTVSSSSPTNASSKALSSSSTTNFSLYSSSTLPSSPTNASFSPSSKVFSSSSTTNFSLNSSSTLPSSPTNASFSPSSKVFSSSSTTNFSLNSSSTLPSSPTNASFATSSNALSSSSLRSNASFSSPSTALSSSFPNTNDPFLSSSNALNSSSPSTNAPFSSSPTTFSSSSPRTNALFSSSSTAFSSSSPSINATFSAPSTAISSRPTTASSSFFSSSSSASSDELRLVLLGRAGSGKSAAGNTILSRDEFKLRKDDATGPTTQSCVKGTAVIGKKRIAVVDTPDWFWPSCPPEKLANDLSSCMDLCAPGPHAFLLCVPVTLPGRSNLHDLGSIKNSFGPDALRHTLVLFTHSDMLKDRNVEEYIAAMRPELLELVEKCGDRYHVLKQGRNQGNKEELLEKLEQLVKESGGNHYSYQGQEELGRERITQLRGGRGGENDMDRALSTTLHSLREEEEVEQEEKNAKPVESTSMTVTSMLSSVLRFVGQKVGEGAKQVPKLVAGGAVLGGVLGLYVGGPVGGAVGATAGSVATEYGRRKYNKPKTD